MRNFNRNNRGGGRSDDRQMHNATCADCGKACKIPFKPTSDKPVYCSNCFKGDRAPRGDGGGRGRGRDKGGDRRGDRQMHRATCVDCGRSCEVPFRPSGDKPVYCSQCFERVDSSSGQGKSDKSSKKHDKINAKLDKILLLLQSMNPVKEKAAKKTKKEEKAPKKAEKKTASEKVAKKAPVKKTATKKATKKTPVKKAAPKKETKKAPAKKTVKKTPAKKKAK